MKTKGRILLVGFGSEVSSELRERLVANELYVCEATSVKVAISQFSSWQPHVVIISSVFPFGFGSHMETIRILELSYAENFDAIDTEAGFVFLTWLRKKEEEKSKPRYPSCVLYISQATICDNRHSIKKLLGMHGKLYHKIAPIHYLENDALVATGYKTWFNVFDFAEDYRAPPNLLVLV